jgi:hypothetical protein
LPAELEQKDRRELDDAVFELLGVNDADKRTALIDQLYRELTIHFRGVRIVEVQKMEQRRQGSGSREVSASDLAEDAWKELKEDLKEPLALWLAESAGTGNTIQIPEGAVRLPDAGHFFEANTVFFGAKPTLGVECESREQAELIFAIATAGLRGSVLVPVAPEACRALLTKLSDRLARLNEHLTTLAEVRVGSEKLRAQVLDLMYRWATNGRPN